MTKDQYVDHCWELGEEYFKLIEDGTIRANKWIKLAVQRFKHDLKREDLYYDKEKVDKVFKFFYYIFIEPKTRFEPVPYQIFIIMNLFGFYRKKSKKRKYRYAFFFLAKKNGKTTFSAALQLYFMIADSVTDPESILVASNKTQASLASEAAAKIISYSPALRKRLESFGPKDARNRIVFKDKNKAGFCKSFAAFADRLDGFHPSSAILDEVHTYRDYSIYNIVRQGIGVRENPMILAISTAGYIMDSVCHDLFENGKKHLEDIENADDNYFYLLYTLDDGDDPDDSENWVKSNPSIGYFDIDDFLKNEHTQSFLTEKQRAAFFTKNLNLFTDNPDTWIDKERMSKRFAKVNIDDFKGEDCYLGVDFSKNTDFTSVTLTFKKEKLYSFTYLFIAKDADKRADWNGKENIRKWIKMGHIIECDKDIIDYDLIYRYIMEWYEKFNIMQLNYDAAYSREIIPRLNAEGVNCKPYRQGAMSMTGPIKELELKVFDESIIFNYNPCVEWHFNNIVLNENQWGNVMFSKNYKLDPIDAAISNAMSMAAYLQNNTYGDYDLSVFS